MKTKEIYEKIIRFLSLKGPSLPIQIAKELNMNSLFVSAFLAEMVDNNKIKISNLKVGGSPLYFLGGHEARLENFYNYLHPAEAETFLLLKKSKFLRDSEQEPAVRVALRNIKDFAIDLNLNNEIYWKYFLVSEQEVNELLKVIKEKYVEKEEKEVEKEIKREKVFREAEKAIVVEKARMLPRTAEKKKEINEIEILEFNPLVIPEKTEKLKKERPKSNFVLKVIHFINEKGFKIIEEKSYKNKEYNCIVEIKSQLGNIRFFTQAKDKKSISDKELRKLVSDAQKIPLPAFIIYTGKLSKKAEDFLARYSSVLKAARI